LGTVDQKGTTPKWVASRVLTRQWNPRWGFVIGELARREPRPPRVALQSTERYFWAPKRLFWAPETYFQGLENTFSLVGTYFQPPKT